ncbi:acyl carrier protein [Erythrobacter sp. NE805]|uniref:acyl carrier protein n=1 Tax=Erythrobacter sp. NE805 TaxID=3389875 RepID=UPI00396B1084
MIRADVTTRIARLMEDVFDLDELAYEETLSAADIEEWDSLSNIRFVVAIEKEFGVRFSNSEVAGLDNVGQMVDLIISKAA